MAQLKQRFNFESVLLFGLNCFDDLMSSSTAMEQPSQLPLTYAEIESIAFDCSMSNLDSIVQEISEIRFQVNK